MLESSNPYIEKNIAREKISDINDVFEDVPIEALNLSPEKCNPPSSIPANIPIEHLNLSVRSWNCLKRADKHYVHDLIGITEESLGKIRNMGKKSIDEIISKVSEFLSDYSLEISANIPLFHDADLILREDIPIEKLVRTPGKCRILKDAGYSFASQLIDADENSLTEIKGVSSQMIKTLLETVAQLSFKEAQPPENELSENASCANFAIEASKVLDINGRKLYKDTLPIFERVDILGRESESHELFTVECLRRAVKNRILSFLNDFPFGVSSSDVKELLPTDFICPSILDKIIYEMESDSEIVVVGDLIERRQMTILEYLVSDFIKKENYREIAKKRILEDKTLDEIGKECEPTVTRERVRQIVKKVMSHRNKPLLREDRYREIFEKYELSQENFVLATGEPEFVYYYLREVSKNGDLPIANMMDDLTLPEYMRRGAMRVVYKHHITINGERVHKSRLEIVKYVVRTYFQNKGTYAEFISRYNETIETVGLSDECALHEHFDNTLSTYDFVRWLGNGCFRYCNIDSDAFHSLWDELGFNDYKNIEYSTLKFFRENPVLMQKHDIQSERGLHNLLKKQCAKHGIENPNFNRMPMVEFGTANRDKQVKDMLFQLAPVTKDDFAEAYLNEYGVEPTTFRANYINCIREYYNEHNEMYEIDTPPLPTMHEEHMKSILTAEYYDIDDIRRIYSREFPDVSVENINPYTIKTLGFNVYVSYAIKNIYGSVSEYVRMLLTTHDKVNAEDFPPGITKKISYFSELNTLKSRYEIVEFEPGQYINMRRLNENGITVELIKEYCDAVADIVTDCDFFTIASLRNNGFSHDLEENTGFSDIFFSSLLTEDISRFTYQRMGGTKLFRRGVQNASLKEFIAFIVEQKTAIDIYDLLELLIVNYGLKIEKHKIVSAARESSLYYSDITEKMYADYSIYLEEV